MKIKTLFHNIKDIKIIGNRETDITGLCNFSQKVSVGNLFVAKKGKKFDATSFIPEAISNGAVAILTDMADPFLEKKIVQIVTQDVDQTEREIAQRYYDDPSNELFMIGVTGTSGKTTTTYLIHHLLEKMKVRCGLMGTVETITGKNRYFSSLTTNDLLTNQKTLREMVSHGCKACVMEVSSQGLDQKRVENIRFNVAIFTNLTHEHLDYHKTYDNYFAAKMKLFSSLTKEKNKKPTIAIVNADSSYSERISQWTSASMFTFGIEKNADLRAIDMHLSMDGTKVLLAFQNQKEWFSTPLIGKFNVSNLLAAVSLGLAFGFTLEEMKDVFTSLPQIPGRLERVAHRHSFAVFVDYAHKEDALRQVLIALRSVAKRRVLTLFGCGGDRDKEKRPRMAKAAEEYSDFVVVTSDNPRSEDPKKIVEEIVSGFSSSRYIVELDRKAAIEKMMQLAGKDDIVLIAGKGHETYQLFSNRRIDFDDRFIVREVCDAF